MMILLLIMICITMTTKTTGKVVYNRIRKELKEIPSDIQNNANEILLQYNRIRIIPPKVFFNLTKCKVINLRNNELHTIEFDGLKGLKKLKQLYLQNNKLTFIGFGTFQGVRKSLQFLNVDHNLLSTVKPATFTCFIKLRWLFLEYNSLTLLDARLFQYVRKSLEKLHLYGNWFLRKIHPNALQGLKVEMLNVENSQIEIIQNDTFLGVDNPINHIKHIKFLAMQ